MLSVFVKNRIGDIAILCRTAQHLMATPTQSIKWIIKMALSKIGFVTLVFHFKIFLYHFYMFKIFTVPFPNFRVRLLKNC